MPATRSVFASGAQDLGAWLRVTFWRQRFAPRFLACVYADMLASAVLLVCPLCLSSHLLAGLRPTPAVFSRVTSSCSLPLRFLCFPKTRLLFPTRFPATAVLVCGLQLCHVFIFLGE